LKLLIKLLASDFIYPSDWSDEKDIFYQVL